MKRKRKKHTSNSLTDIYPCRFFRTQKHEVRWYQETVKPVKYKTVDLTLTDELSEEKKRALAGIKHDNPFNSKEFVGNLKKEDKGSIFYDRYILGLWVATEGGIYRLFADDAEMCKAKYKVAEAY